MPADSTLISLADLVRRAAAIVDPDSEDPAVAELVARHDDADEPVRGILDSLEERLGWGVDEDPAVVMAQAVVLYLAHRLDELEAPPEQILQLAARSEFDGDPPPAVREWLAAGEDAA
jgi:hypothetical protein